VRVTLYNQLALVLYGLDARVNKAEDLSASRVWVVDSRIQIRVEISC
jgi:hypothetical protein